MQPQPLTEPEIQQAYSLLEKMYVPLEESKTLQGLNYIRERLTLCRAMLDQCQDLRVRTMLAYSKVQEQVIFNKSQLLQARGNAQLEKQLKLKAMELEQQKVSHRTLSSMVAAQSAVLLQTQRDIKSLTDVMKVQLKLAEIGGVDPHEAEEALVQQADLSQIGNPVGAPSVQISVGPEPGEQVKADDWDGGPLSRVPVVPEPPAGESEFAGLFASMKPLMERVVTSKPALAATSTQMETVNFGDPVGTPVESAPRGIPVTDLSSVPIESLFQEDTNGVPIATHPVI